MFVAKHLIAALCTNREVAKKMFIKRGRGVVKGQATEEKCLFSNCNSKIVFTLQVATSSRVGGHIKNIFLRQP